MTWTHDERYDDIDFDDPAVQRAYAVHGTILTPLDDAINAGSPGPASPATDTSWWDADVPQGGDDPLVGYVNGKFDSGEWA